MLPQFVGTIVASTFSFGTGWWLLTSIDNICNLDKLPDGSPWTCPGDGVFYSASIIWGLIGPAQMFGKLGLYTKMNWFFLIGLLAPVPVWLLSKAFPQHKWIRLIHMPVLLGATGVMPPARSVNFIMWGFVGVIINYYVFKYYKDWWARHTYVLSAALDAGVAFMGVLSFFTLGNYNIDGIDWWGGEGYDHCPLALCPTAPGIVREGCPVL